MNNLGLISDIEKELRHYSAEFKNKTILCNCDDPEWSNFWKYFELNFQHLGLKKLISTHYETDKPSYKLELEAEKGITKTPLSQNGDFRSPECVDLLKDADIVITNPPFSLVREYVAQLMEYNKKFLIIANQNNLHYKEIFPLVRENKLWVGYNHGSQSFRVPDDYDKNNVYVGEDGKKYAKFGNIIWLTNLDVVTRHEHFIFYKKYSPDDYTHYDNYDAIDVNVVSDIPEDYFGLMGVPDGFLFQYNPDEFELIGIGSGNLAKEIGVEKNYRGRSDVAFTTPEGKHKCPYSRIIIRRKPQ